MAHATGDLAATDIEAYLHQHEHKSMLRFITCGSVDDGKSTLIGRLLYDSKLVFEDHLAALESDSKKVGTQGGELDFALLVDGLAAEREQGITIDVAYRFFSTEKRKFIVADTPGHEQYTRNMVTGASTADLAVILIDARRGVLTQTRRHSFLVSLLGIRHVLLAINKLDLEDYSQEVFDRIEADYRTFAAEIGLDDITCIPISALRGDNITEPSPNMPWYSGPTLIGHLETIEIDDVVHQGSFRLPVQWVNRPNLDFRGFSGEIVGGSVRPGDPVRVVPSGRESTVARIVTLDGDLDEAVAGQSVTITLADEIDVSRGDVLAAADDPPAVADQFECHLVWMGEDPMLPGRPYLLKIGTRTATATVAHPKYKVNVNTLEHTAAKTLELNEIGVCNISLDRPVPFDPYAVNRDMGGFILIDRFTNNTVAAGLLHFALRRADNVHWQAVDVDKTARAALKGQQGAVVWFTGLSGAGKSTIANIVEQKLHNEGRHTYLLDGDNVRHGLNRDPGLHGCGPRREHPPRLRGGPPDGRRRPDRARLIHLPVPLRAAHGARPGGRRRVRRGVRRRRPRGRRRPRPQGSLRQGTPWRTDELHRHRFAVRGAREPRGAHRRQRRRDRRGRRRPRDRPSAWGWTALATCRSRLMSTPAPRLRLDLNIGTTWLLPDWSTGPVGTEDAMLAASRRDGYAGVQGADAARCRDLGLIATTSDIVRTSGGVRDRAERWADAGYSSATLMLGTGFDDPDTASRIVEEVLEASRTVRFPLYVETHRATITQDIWRTLQLIERFPEIRFNGDFSHWYTGHDIGTWEFADALEALAPVFERVRYLHGRIGTPGCIQVDVGDGGADGQPHVAHFCEMWTRSFKGFIAHCHTDEVAPPRGEIGFAPELLPAEFGYARTVRTADGTITDECDRWAQALVLCRLATECFAGASGSLT